MRWSDWRPAGASPTTWSKPTDVLLVWGVGLLMLNFWWERKAEIAQSAAPALAAEESGSS